MFGVQLISPSLIAATSRQVTGFKKIATGDISKRPRIFPAGFQCLTPQRLMFGGHNKT
jgi:hypothetical protein